MFMVLAILAIGLIAADPISSGNPIIDWLANTGALGILAFIVVGFLRGWIVTGRELTRVTEERNRAMELVYKQAELTQKALELSAEKK